MFYSLTNYVFFPIILLVFTSTSVFSDCIYDQTCFDNFMQWCCPYEKTCGNSYESCEDPSSLSSAATAITIISATFLFVMCLTCCIQLQRRRRLRNAYANSNIRVVTNPSQQHVFRSPAGVVHVRSIYNVGTAPSSQPYPSMYEAPPPSYEIATASLPSVTTTVQ